MATVGEGDSNFARNQRMTAAEMMQRKTRLCQEIWQRQVHSQPSLHVLLLCFAIVLCCCALLSCFAVMLCCHALLVLQQMCAPLPFLLCFSCIDSGPWEAFLCLHKMPCHSCGRGTLFLCLFFSCIDCLSRALLCIMLSRPGKGTGSYA